MSIELPRSLQKDRVNEDPGQQQNGGLDYHQIAGTVPLSEWREMQPVSLQTTPQPQDGPMTGGDVGPTVALAPTVRETAQTNLVAPINISSMTDAAGRILSTIKPDHEDLLVAGNEINSLLRGNRPNILLDYRDSHGHDFFQMLLYHTGMRPGHGDHHGHGPHGHHPHHPHRYHPPGFHPTEFHPTGFHPSHHGHNWHQPTSGHDWHPTTWGQTPDWHTRRLDAEGRPLRIGPFTTSDSGGPTTATESQQAWRSFYRFVTQEAREQGQSPQQYLERQYRQWLEVRLGQQPQDGPSLPPHWLRPRESTQPITTVGLWPQAPNPHGPHILERLNGQVPVFPTVRPTLPFYGPEIAGCQNNPPSVNPFRVWQQFQQMLNPLGPEGQLPQLHTYRFRDRPTDVLEDIMNNGRRRAPDVAPVVDLTNLLNPFRVVRPSEAEAPNGGRRERLTDMPIPVPLVDALRTRREDGGDRVVPFRPRETAESLAQIIPPFLRDGIARGGESDRGRPVSDFLTLLVNGRPALSPTSLDDPLGLRTVDRSGLPLVDRLGLMPGLGLGPDGLVAGGTPVNPNPLAGDITGRPVLGAEQFVVTLDPVIGRLEPANLQPVDVVVVDGGDVAALQPLNQPLVLAPEQTLVPIGPVPTVSDLVEATVVPLPIEATEAAPPVVLDGLDGVVPTPVNLEADNAGRIDQIAIAAGIAAVDDHETEAFAIDKKADDTSNNVEDPVATTPVPALQTVPLPDGDDTVLAADLLAMEEQIEDKLGQLGVTAKTATQDEAEEDDMIVYNALRPVKRTIAEDLDDSDSRAGQQRTVVLSTKRRKYIVKEDDTLELISQHQLGDIRFARLIEAINRPVIKYVYEDGQRVPDLEPGLVIWLPSEQELENHRRVYMPQVKGRQEREERVLSSLLDRALGRASKGKNPAPSAMSDLCDALTETATTACGPDGDYESFGATRFYTVRFGDTLKGIAARDPLLANAALWPLLAHINDMTGVESDKVLRRGTVLELPSNQQVNEFMLEDSVAS